MNKREACERWVWGNFSMIPVTLLQKAYGEDWEAISVLAPTYEAVKQEWLAEHGEEYKDEPEYWIEDVIQEACDEQAPLFPMWGYVFVPAYAFEASWFEDYADDVARCGFTVYETDEIGVYLGIQGAGYDFRQAHWLPLYDLRGLRWHDEEEKEV